MQKNLHFCKFCNNIKSPMDKYIRMVDNIQYIFSTSHNNQSTMTKDIVSIDRHIFPNSCFCQCLCIPYSQNEPEILMLYTFSQHLSIYSILDWALSISSKLKNIGPGLSISLNVNSKWVYRFYLVPLWMPRKKSTSRSMNTPNKNLTLYSR